MAALLRNKPQPRSMTDTTITDPAAPAETVAAPAPAPDASAFDSLPENPTQEQVLAAARKATGAADPPPADDADVDEPDDAPDAAAAPDAPAGDWPVLPAGKLIGGKYKSIAEAEKGLKELAALLTKKGAASLKTGDAPKEGAAKGADGKPAEWTELNDEVEMELAAEFFEHGDLKPETYERIHKTFKIPPAKAKAQIEERIEKAKEENVALVGEAGFKDMDGFNAARTWAAQNLKRESLLDLDLLLGSRSAVQRAAGLRYLKSLHAKANPATRARITGDAGVGLGGEPPITSHSEYLAAWEAVDKHGNLLTDVDPAYRAKVLQRAKAGGYRA